MTKRIRDCCSECEEDIVWSERDFQVRAVTYPGTDNFTLFWTIECHNCGNVEDRHTEAGSYAADQILGSNCQLEFVNMNPRENLEIQETIDLDYEIDFAHFVESNDCLVQFIGKEMDK